MGGGEREVVVENWGGGGSFSFFEAHPLIFEGLNRENNKESSNVGFLLGINRSKSWKGGQEVEMFT